MVPAQTEEVVVRSDIERSYFEDPNAQLEMALIDEFLRSRGLDRHMLAELPEAEANALSREACRYATVRLAELESRAHFIHEIHGTAKAS
jgi:hypothetical protein